MSIRNISTVCSSDYISVYVLPYYFRCFVNLYPHIHFGRMRISGIIDMINSIQERDAISHKNTPFYSYVGYYCMKNLSNTKFKVLFIRFL